MTFSSTHKVTISVLMSVYNGQNWLSEAIDSVLKQTFHDFEFIIVDDGSTDHTSEILHFYQSLDSRIKIFPKANTGLTDSLNYGASFAGGEWIARLDSDDICEVTRLSKQYEYVTAHPDVIWLGSGLTLVNSHNSPIRTYTYPSQDNQLRSNLYSHRRFPPHSSAFFRRDIFLSIGGYRRVMLRAQDWDLWLRLSDYGSLACLKDTLVRIRQHPSQVSNLQAGRRQLIDATVAIASAWLRRWGYPDPLSSSQRQYTLFHRFISFGLYKLGDLQHSLHFREVKQTIPNFSIVSFFRVLRFLITKNLFLLFFKQIYISIFGSSSAKLLARFWTLRSLSK